MQIETLKDVLHWATEFHQHLSSCLSHCTDQNESDRAKLLLGYLEAHESKLALVLGQFEKKVSSNALNTWCYEFLNKHPITQHEYCDAPFAQLDAVQIMALIVDQHHQIIELYRYLFSRADNPSAKELLKNLKSLEEHEVMVMSQGANRLNDL